MVIGYNPSHSNVNSEVNAPFKILSLMLRFLENELNPKKQGRRQYTVQNYENDEEEEEKGITPGYKMRRDLLGEGERLDTVEGDDEMGNNDYGEEYAGHSKDREVEKIEMTLDDVQDEDDNESLLGMSKNKEGGSTTGSLKNMITVKESNDRGLADMETGSEVYMSELLV